LVSATRLAVGVLPLPTSGLAFVDPAARLQRRAWLRRQDERLDAVVAKSLARSRCRLVEERASVACAIRHQSRDFQGPVLVGLAGHWSAHDDGTHQPSIVPCPDGEAMTLDRLVVSMEIGDYIVRLRQLQMDDVQ
jgi:hypothetical protein